jgi:hypothetical protein
LFHSKPQQRHKEVEKLVGKEIKCVNFNLDDTDTKLANQLNVHLASIVQTLPSLRPDEIPQPPPDYQDLPTITAKMVTKKLRMLKQTSVTPIDIPM